MFRKKVTFPTQHLPKPTKTKLNLVMLYNNSCMDCRLNRWLIDCMISRIDCLFLLSSFVIIFTDSTPTVGHNVPCVTHNALLYKSKLCMFHLSNCCSIHIDFIFIVPYWLLHIECSILNVPYWMFHIQCSLWNVLY